MGPLKSNDRPIKYFSINSTKPSSRTQILQPAVKYTWRMVGVELAISIPGPRPVSLSSDVDGGS